MTSERKNKFRDLTVKVCTGCDRELPLDAFYQKSAEGVEGQRYKTAYGRAMGPCKECRKAKAREYKESPERKLQVREWNLKTIYGISLDDYEEMLSSQGGVCAICGDSPSGVGYRNNYLHVDHCHRTGKIRGLLCRNCNKGLGCFRDRIDLLHRGAEYLKG